MTLYAQLCGRALAKAHARSGDAIAIASYLGAGDSFDRALATFAETYADQNERDYDGAAARPSPPAASSPRAASERDGPVSAVGDSLGRAACGDRVSAYGLRATRDRRRAARRP